MINLLVSPLLILIITANICLGGNDRVPIAYPPDLIQLHQNVWTDILSGNIEKNNVQKTSAQLTDQGIWPDIDYSSKQRGDWPPVSHLNRLLTLSMAYQKQDSPFYHDPAMLSKIHLALNYWLTNDLQCPNWWYPEIGVPMSLVPSMILMENEMTREQMEQGIRILDRAKLRLTGQNKVWLAGNVLLKSLLLRDTET
ncbi:MAG TPA: hypothetical protein VN249_09305, partial [Prolixibacteraceae bacterium]|nr:hypothetical protein [Prolixibacteraceae bacterium]